MLREIPKTYILYLYTIGKFRRLVSHFYIDSGSSESLE